MTRLYFCGDKTQSELLAILGAAPSAEIVESPFAASHLVASHHPDSLSEFLSSVTPDHVTLFLAGECEVPDFNLFDYAIGFDLLHFGRRYVRPHPLIRFANWVAAADAVVNHANTGGLESRPYFCDFIYSNPAAHSQRGKIFESLSLRESVQSWGVVYNNAGQDFVRTSWDSDWREAKLRLQAQHRFSIAAENAEYRGYTSEKIISSFLAGSIPIYWGNPEIALDFNPERMVNLYDFGSLDEAWDYVLDLDANGSRWLEKSKLPILTYSQQEALSSSRVEIERVIADFLETRGGSSRLRGLGTHPFAYLERRKRESKCGSRNVWARFFREISSLR